MTAFEFLLDVNDILINEINTKFFSSFYTIFQSFVLTINISLNDMILY
jgi:hypothetical protein